MILKRFVIPCGILCAMTLLAGSLIVSEPPPAYGPGPAPPGVNPFAKFDTLKTDLDELQKIVKGLDGIETQAGTVLTTANSFLSTTDKHLQEQLNQLHVTLLNLKVISTHAKALVEALGEKPNRLIFSGKPAKLTPEADIIKSSKPLPARP